MRLPGLQIYPLKAGDFQTIQTAAAADAHSALCPTQKLVKDGECVGYLSINAIPTAMLWFGPQMKARDSFQAMQFAENYVAGNGGQAILLPVPVSSPLCKYLNPIGYSEANGDHRLFVKLL